MILGYAQGLCDGLDYAPEHPSGGYLTPDLVAGVCIFFLLDELFPLGGRSPPLI